MGELRILVHVTVAVCTRRQLGSSDVDLDSLCPSDMLHSQRCGSFQAEPKEMVFVLDGVNGYLLVQLMLALRLGCFFADGPAMVQRKG